EPKKNRSFNEIAGGRSRCGTGWQSFPWWHEPALQGSRLSVRPYTQPRLSSWLADFLYRDAAPVPDKESLFPPEYGREAHNAQHHAAAQRYETSRSPKTRYKNLNQAAYPPFLCLL